MMKILKKLWHKLFPIKQYLRDVHYSVGSDDVTSSDILTIILLKGPYAPAVVGFETITTDEDMPQIVLKTRLIESPSGYDFTKKKDWYEVSVQIFEDEYKAALENYQKLRQEIFNDEDDRTNYIEEPSEERTVSPQGNSLSKKRVLSKQKRKASIPGDGRIYSKVQPPTDHGSDTDIFGNKG